MLPEQIFLLEKVMTWPMLLSIDAKWYCQNKAIEAVWIYCSIIEGGP
jgi:hypothetical protein